MKKIFACVSLAFYIAAVVMFALSFIDAKAVVLGETSVKSLATGFEIAFGQTKLEANNTLGTLFAFIFVVFGALAACYALFVAFTQKKAKKGNKTAKLLCAVCSFVVCALVPALLFFLTLQTTETAASASAFGGLLGANTQLGIGAILAAVFTLLGGCSLSVVEIK